MAQFFVHRPVFAWVIAVLVMLMGAISLWRLPIEQYPQIAPTTINVSATYGGANAEVVANSVTSLIEDALTGIEGVIYMTSSSSAGSASVALTFADGVDPDIAQVQVQNALQRVTAQLPSIVQQNGVSVQRSSSSTLLVAALVDERSNSTSLELGDLVTGRIVGPVQRLDGVGAVQLFGSGYAMRIWMDPLRLTQFGVTPEDVTAAVTDQNANVTVGELGGQPIPIGQQITIPLSAQSQLRTAAEFERILLKTSRDGSTVFLGDVADISIGQESYGTSGRYNGQPAAGFSVSLTPGANTVATAGLVRETLAALAEALPEGVEVAYPYDISPFIEQSIEQVYYTLIEAVVLVFVVIFVFLQSWRATLIPVVAVPVVLLGTFGVLLLFGYTINTLTMFALVLAIGLLVDDAIVVVENVERIMHEEGLDPVAATEKSMKEITSALIGIVLVLSAVFLPMAFMTGSTGAIYRQFSVTIITAMALSLGVAVILTPAMCATLLKQNRHGARFGPARWFNASLERTTSGYGRSVAVLIRRPFAMLVVLAAITASALWFYDRLPSSFIPQEDQGVLLVMVATPDGSTTPKTEARVAEVEDYLLHTSGGAVESVFGVMGFSFNGSGQSSAMLFVKLADYEQRDGITASDLAAQVNQHFYLNNRSGTVYALQPPAIQGMGATSGFSMYLVDRSGQGANRTAEAADAIVAAAQRDGRVTNLRGNESSVRTSLRIEIDQQKAAALGLSVSSVNAMLSVIFSGLEVGDFPMAEDLRPVIVQGQAEARSQPEDIGRWYARNDTNEMVSLDAFTTLVWDEQPTSIDRFAATQGLALTGTAAKGVSSGDAMLAMEELVSEHGGGFGVEWTDLSYQERLSGNQAPLLYALSALVVFLALAALYESWALPLAVMMTVPVGIFGAIGAALYFGQLNDVYFKVGLLTTIGLAARNAILIVEFAEEQRREGKALVEAAIAACRMRLRPILMTTLAFMFGVLPLATASGAGAAAQQSIGIGVLGGMAAAAVIGIFLVPVFYVGIVGSVARVRTPRQPTKA
ncbi:hydrophobe/amphiphile efflux-1 (HAE1) family protein (plasmid) [Cereibacter sphaeroides WS8N]|uniref:multidrug efflux RND transporter permease subunit n=1 Tax=Cereibacter sphaeroides TaxID=1063 RepID=UPI00020B0288|nr:multidrug efflux RND transporter permease subunit [Cereibacter sphaeroides]AZB66395.1 multidrug efflux RND transporter permease subunit [Cereibacter sphaeroides]AZB71060.1 multidrug efflux RND transporter permease subunit [Cereibacter sphaeroides]EGJ19287.1 hydrophobe/amphiphile efflux-1 (HAE1) family protein [Cereibacter sphaeroides WS8N]